jgi:hypothetical protein
MDIKSKALFNMACYDLDAFRYHIFNKGMLDGYHFEADVRQKIKDSDVELLKLGFTWIKDTLFKNGN